MMRFRWISSVLGRHASTRLRSVALKIEAEARRLNGLHPTGHAGTNDVVSMLESASALLEQFDATRSSGQDTSPSAHEAAPRIVQIALEIETYARRLNGISVPAAGGAGAELEEILESVRHLLARKCDGISAGDEARVSSTARVATPHILTNTTEEVDESLPPSAHTLIDLRDWIQQARASGKAVPSSFLDKMYQDLGKALELEGLTSLDGTAVRNEEHQFVREIKATDDPTEDGRVYESLLPGYVFHGRLIRYQEVSVLAYSGSGAQSSN